MIRRILVPLDGSPRSESVLPTATSIAGKLGAELQLAMVHVPGAYAGDAPWDDFDREAIAAGRVYLDAVAAGVKKSFPGTIKLHLLEGLVPETLATEAVAQQIDLVILNAHGFGFVTRSILGSVSDYLMRHIRIPMLLMHSSPEAEAARQPAHFDRILVCLDGSKPAEALLLPSLMLGGLWNSEVRLLQVVPPPTHSLESFNAERRQQYDSLQSKAGAAAEKYLAKVASNLPPNRCKVTTQVSLRQNPAQAILHEAKAGDCDLISITTNGRGGLARLLLGSVADKVIRGAETPVLVYYPPDE